MKNLLTYLILLIVAAATCQGQSKENLVGTWEFEKMMVKNGNQVDTIWHGQAHEIANGPKLTYNADGSYTKQFTPKNTDSGTWVYDANKKEILHDLIYKKPYSFAAKYLIDSGHAKKNKKGDYYEVITDEVIELSNEKLIISARDGNRRIYKKLK